VCQRAGVAHSYSAIEAKRNYQQRVQALAKYRKTLVDLLPNRGIEQRTDTWYAARKKLITASDAAQALGEGKFGTQRDFFEKKLELAPPMDFNIPPLMFGQCYEPVAARVYSHMFGVEVYEFGLLIHPNHDFIGASPDGINEHGIMLEIKCPYRRLIDGSVPAQYYMQMQLQLDVCDLDECDYFECEIDEIYEDEFLQLSEAFPEAYTGAIVTTAGEREYRFSFGEDLHAPQALVEWVSQNRSGTFWVLRKHHVQRVHRDPLYLQNKIQALRQVYDQLQGYAQDPASFPEKPPKRVIRKKQPEGCMFIDSEPET
jgi:putative phage-type endonuclease